MRIRWSRMALLAVAGLMTMTALAVAKSATIGVGRASVNGHKESVAVNARGVTVYELGPETTHHLVCRSRACFAAWPPVKAKGAVTKMAGVKGRLGTIRRGGFTQVTLNGKPVYTFVEDGGRRGEAQGDGIRNFGGVWHVFRES
jgi:predicted lipoprotein with Yx(FWY)xxD motif